MIIVVYGVHFQLDTKASEQSIVRFDQLEDLSLKALTIAFWEILVQINI